MDKPGTQDQKLRHGCLAGWLLFILGINLAVAFIYLFGWGMVTELIPGNADSSVILILGLLSIVNVALAIMLFLWRKAGFYGFILTGILIFILKLWIGFTVPHALVEILTIAILYAVLQLKQQGISGWDILNRS